MFQGSNSSKIQENQRRNPPSIERSPHRHRPYRGNYLEINYQHIALNLAILGYFLHLARKFNKH